MARFSPTPSRKAGLCRWASTIRTDSHRRFFLNSTKAWHLCSAFVVLIGLVFSGCSSSPQTTNTPRSTLEQLLLSQSLERTLRAASIPFVPGESVSVEAVGLTGDKDFAKELVVHWLRQKGLRVGTEAPKYLIRVVLHAFGTEQSVTFFGIPAIQSTIIPFALPELAIYKAIKQRGYTRLFLEVSDKKSGALIASSPAFEDDVYYNQYVFLFIFTNDSTDIVPPPL